MENSRISLNDQDGHKKVSEFIETEYDIDQELARKEEELKQKILK
jgi:hypothetical protein